MAEAKRRQFKKKVVISTNIISEKLYYNASDNEEVTGLLAEQILTRCKTLRNEQDEEIESSKLRNLTVKEREEKKKRLCRSLSQRDTSWCWWGKEFLVLKTVLRILKSLDSNNKCS